MRKLGTYLATAIIILFFISPSVLLVAGDAILTWNPNTDSVAGYKVYYGTVSHTYGSPIDVGNQTTYTVTGLPTGTYYFAVTAYNSSQNQSGFSNEVSKTIAVADTTPPTISATTASSITQTGATISWTTNEASDTQVEYGTTTGYGSSTTLNSSLVTSHTATLSGLTANTQYHYRVKSRDAAGNLATSSDINFNTAQDTTPPVFSAVSASSITQSGATIGWTTDEASDTQVDYGPTASYGSSTTLNTSLVTSHSATLLGLTASTVYHYRVRSRDAASNLAISADFTFTTAADTTAPVISGTAATPITQSGATISWTTNEASDTQVDYGTTTSYGSSTTLNSSLVTAHSAAVSGLTASTLYHYRVKSRDSAGNLATSSDFTFTTAADTTPPTISSVSASSITQTGATITWTTNEASDTQVDYGTTTGYGSSTTLNSSLVTSHTATLSGLTANTQYHFRVKSRDAAGNLATSSDINFTTAADTTPPVFSAVSASSITQSGATIGWTTDEASDTQVDYGPTTSYGSSTTLNTSLVTSHSAVLSGLTASSLYHYRVKSRDAAGNLATSGDLTFTTAADTTPPVISGTAAAPVTQSGATITWTTNEAGDTQVDYGTTASYGSSTTLNTSLVTSHSAVLSGLTASSLYHYRVKSRDAAGNLATSGDFTFTTSADTTAPVVSAISASSITLSGATISWATDEASDTQVDYGTTVGYGSSTTLNTSLVTSHAASLSGLTASTVYHYRVKSRDAAGNLATSGDFTFTTAADATPPTMPTGLSANAASSTQINLSWTASTDNVAVTGYKIFRNSSQITTTAGTSFQDTGLNPSTSYSYTISAYDAAGNNSASSTAASATTQAPPDTTPPVISAVAAAPITSTSATVNWTTDEAADSQVEYGTTTAYGSSTTLDGNRATTHSQLVSGLTSATPYHYRVRARDAAGNLALSGDSTFTTLSLCDVNGDGGINAIDLQAVINAILSGTNPAKLDINLDGAVDVLDLQILNNVILGVRTCPT